MKALLAKLITKYLQTSVSYRFYLASILTYLIGLTAYSHAGPPALTAGTTVASAFIICGFVAWCFPIARWLHTVWDQPLSKVPIIILHLLALLVSTACARFAVAESLGLPPQSFDLTVGFLALLFYIPSLLGVVAVILFGVALLMLIVALAGLLLDTVWKNMTPILSLFGYKTTQRASRNIIIFHSIGALISSILLAFSYSYLTNNFSPAFKAVTKIIALRSDFHITPNYPGGHTAEYIHPLENGFIAFAREEQDKHVVIGVRLQSTEPQNIVIEDIPSVKTIMSGVIERFH